jgi:hypothetical protein
VKPKTLLVLTLLAAGLGAYAWFVDRKQPGTDERAETAKRVFRFETEEVEGLTIELGARRLRLEREPEAPAKEGAAAVERGWRLAEPLTAKADSALVRSLLSALVGLDRERRLEDFDAQELGLVSPRARVVVRTQDGEQALAIGAALPGGSSTVAQLGGRKEALVVPSSFWSDLEREAIDWRDKTVFVGDRSAIQSLAWARPSGESVRLGKRGEAFWLESPLGDRADREEVDRLLGVVTGLKATRFVTEPAGDLATLGLAPAVTTLGVALNGQAEPFRLEVGAPESPGSLGRYARAGGEVFTTDADLSVLLDKEGAAWRSRAWTGFSSWEIEGAEVRDGSGKLVLARVDGDWQRDGVAIPYTPVADLLGVLTEARAEGFGEALPTTGPAPIEVVLKGKAEASETLSLYPVADGLSPARSSERSAVLLLPAKTLEEWSTKLAALRSATPLPKEEAKVDAGALEVEVEEGSAE